jgi:curved DNA-binding protein CbpA
MIMPDPYTILGLTTDSSDDVIRRRYLTLVRTYTPDRAPERFAAIRQAYEKLRDPVSRLRYRLFEAGQDDSLAAIIADAKAGMPRQRIPVDELLALGRTRV